MPSPLGSRHWQTARRPSMFTAVDSLQSGRQPGRATVQIPEQRLQNGAISVHHTDCRCSWSDTGNGKHLSEHHGLHCRRYWIRNRCLRHGPESIVAHAEQVLLSESTFRNVQHRRWIVRPDGRRVRIVRVAENRSANWFVRCWLPFSQTSF